MLIDRYNRIHDYLRISLTDNCNLRCQYCMPDEIYHFMKNDKLMQADEIKSLAKLFVQNGVKKIRLTGGEPFVRKDIGDILMRLTQLPVEIAITTNATRLHLYWDVLEKSNAKSLNISLDTLSAERFFQITKRDQFHIVWENINEAIRRNFHVKINMVVMRGVNDDEVLDFVRLTENNNIEVRFIEFMPFEGNEWNCQEVVSMESLLESIQQNWSIESIAHYIHDTSRKYKVIGFKGQFGFISTMTAPFCSGCNRLRLTADGKMKNCLFSQNEVDLLTPLRKNENVLELIHQNVLDKAKELGGQFTTDLDKIDPLQLQNRSMISIGG
ncbi:GTP 3',8-cyclase MoaA [Rhizosphaericola mali]|uniref:GTP 3',8-cyclase n=1 Tax=Rhizosphaericola mali TaxID=2545455 RepID=A0A5P2G139_9BACT|nr:GTP 3',8-cyclase MoaA [Rhizosphaericola mali]QES88388.1 GTP 3',8-cyclase MoaA [Rhizosphaericola mali]